MAPEVRSILRYMDDYISSGDYPSAIERAIQALKQYDQEREFNDAIMVLEKLVSIAEHQKDLVQMAKYVDNMRVRALLGGNQSKLKEINSNYSDLPQTPIRSLLDEVTDDQRNIIVETIEKQTIFGDFEPMQNVPYLRFQVHEDAIDIIEEFYEEGRYIINLLDTTTSLHQSVNLDVGNPEDVNILDRDRIFKIHH